MLCCGLEKKFLWVFCSNWLKSSLVGRFCRLIWLVFRCCRMLFCVDGFSLVNGLFWLVLF